MMYQFNSAVRLLSLFATTSATKYFSHPSETTRCDRGIVPPEFSTNVVRLTCDSTAKGGVCDVYLVGVQHRYPKSIEDVKGVVNSVKPQAVFLEVPPERAEFLVNKVEVTYWSLGSYYIKRTRKLVEETEFNAAIEEANKLGAKIVFGDIPREITHRRYNDEMFRMPFWMSAKHYLSCLLPKKMPNLDEMYKASFPRVNEMSSEYQNPIMIKFLVDERDQYMSAKLLEVASEHNTVVAVVGKCHVLGIQKYWKQPIEVEKLLSMPAAPSVPSILGEFSIFTGGVCFCIYLHKKFLRKKK